MVKQLIQELIEWVETYSFVYFTGCNVNVQRHLGAPQPLYLRPADGQFVLPQTINGIIQVQANGTINVHCPSGFQGRFQSHRERTINTTCISGNDFRAVNTQIRFNELRCVSLPPHQVRRMPQRCLGGHLFEVGFNAESRFLRYKQNSAFLQPRFKF